jgi:choline dehydrogenase-like flavoprotein
MSDSITDYLILGAGSAGCALAGRLSEERDTHVTLLEAGVRDSSVLIHCPSGMAVMAQTGTANWSFNTVPQRGLNGRTGYQPRGKVPVGPTRTFCRISNVPRTMNVAATNFMALAAR